MSIVRITIAASFVLVSSCGFTQERADSDEMYVKAAELKKLTGAVESTVRYKTPPAGVSGEELLDLATAHNPALLGGFKDYLLRVRSLNQHAVVLVCSRSGSLALLEDAGCTGEVDMHHWQTEPPRQCEFSLNVEALCNPN